MIKAIVYKSNTGHTLRYAKMLKEKLNIPCYSIKEAKTCLSSKEEIVYLGWVCANKICGLSKATKKYNVKCCGAVGAYPESEEYIKGLKNFNKVTMPFFYLHGGIDFSKLKGIQKSIVKMVGKMLEKENKPENEEIYKIFNDGADFVEEKNLDNMLKYILDKN